MLKHKLRLPEGILVLEPAAPLEAADFESVVAEVDPYIATIVLVSSSVRDTMQLGNIPVIKQLTET